MFGFGKRKRELEKTAESVAEKLLADAIREDWHRMGEANEEPPPVDHHLTVKLFLNSWATAAPIQWQLAKGGDPDALRQTARNYLFGTGMPVNPRKARLWLEAARLVEADPLQTPPPVRPFWVSMERELNEILTAKERIQAGEHALQWVKGLRRAAK